MDDNLSIIEEEMEQLSVTTGETCHHLIVDLTSITNDWTVMSDIPHHSPGPTKPDLPQ